MAAQSLGSVKILVQPLKDSLLALARLFFSSRSVRTWNSSSAPQRSSSIVAEFVDAKKIDTAVAGDGLRQLLVVGGLDDLVDELGRQHIADAEALRRGLGPQRDQ